MEMKYVVPDMAQSFGTLEFAGESEPVFERDKNNRRVLARRSYNLYSDVQKGENVVVEIPVQAGEKKFKYEQKVKLVNPKLYGRGYAIGDMGHTDNFPIAIGEYVSIEELNEMYEMIEELPDYIVECLDEFISHYGTLEEVVEHKDDIYYYPDCETMTDVAYYYIDELQALGDIPPSLQNYIDYEAYGRDLDMGGCFIETSRGMCEIPY